MKSLTGTIIAIVIMLGWMTSLYFLLTLDFQFIILALIPGIILQTYLYTGLFITAHDAMHGTISPGNPAINKLFGSLSVALYALMFYPLLNKEHKKHHLFPGSNQDPDFHEEGNLSFFAWYYKFAAHYIRWWQILGMALLFNILHHLLKVELANLLLFWVLPSLLSTLQLFYFGTYLPHRETSIPFPDKHQANSLEMSQFISLLSCYHFGGYHHEHHLWPQASWWNLPSFTKKMRSLHQ